MADDISYDNPVSDSADPEAAQADALAADLSGDGVTANIDISPAPVDSSVDPEASLSAGEEIVPDSEINASPDPVDATAAALGGNGDGGAFSASGLLGALGLGTSFASPFTSAMQQGINQARQQETMSSQSGQQASATDWRVRISLAKGANYLYNDPTPGILQPLRSTSGVIFPYTPKIDTVYKANYQTYEPTHSNYKGYFYQNSSVDPVTIAGHFTAQNSNDANYLLAVIHFFRSVTKMFYGQDAQKGSPPPLVYLSGFGQYQFNGMPCVVTSFNYSLPDDVDYIRAGVANNLGLNATTISNVLNSAVASGAIGGYARLAAAFTTPGALPATPFGSLATPNLASGAPTMVPTKMDITVTLLPVVSRQKVSQQFSVRNYANGNLLRGGFW